MTLTTKSLSLLTSAAAAAMLCAMPVAADAKVISNTAVVDWTIGSTPMRTLSNRVDITVTPPASEKPAITTYSMSMHGGSKQAPIVPTMCSSNSGPVSITPQGAFASMPVAPANLTENSNFRAGDVIVVGVKLPSANRSATARDTLDVVITMENGDREQIRLSETAENTGEFIGLINTMRVPPAIVSGDCRLSVTPGQSIKMTISGVGQASLTATADISFLVDPFGIVFDSGDGAPVPGSRVTIIDAATGQPAQVFGDDGVSAYPSSVITGQTVTDASGQVYPFPPGDYRFPFVAPGTYRLVVEPPAPYTAPSKAAPADLAPFVRPDNGQAYTINDASYSLPFVLNSPEPVRVDIPIDRPGTGLTLAKVSSTATATPGDVVQYRIEVANNDSRRTTGQVTVSDLLPVGMRLRTDTVRLDGTLTAPTIAPDGRTFTVPVPRLAPGKKALLTYVAEVLVTAQPGSALNRATARDDRGTSSNVAEATIAIRRDTIGDRLTIIGRVTEGGCSVDPRKSAGVANVRVMLQDGSYTVTDIDGRYHFEGVRPGTHVVQIDPSTMPLDREPIDCAHSTRSAGSPISRFVEGRGGSLLRADFRATASTPRQAPAAVSVQRPVVLDDPTAAGANRDWLAGQGPGTAWLFPEPEHNPRSKSVRVAIKHAANQTVELSANGKPVDALAFDGAKKSPAGFAVSSWRGIELNEGNNALVATVRNADGSVAETLTRSVHYSITPMRAELLREKSVLVADGVTRPVIAVRLTDRQGRPIRHGLTGDFAVPAPYYPAMEADAQQARALSGLERARPIWKVEGDDGIAYIELEPTTASGTLSIDFTFRDEKVQRKQTIETWMDPGQRPWTVVGFAAGTVGYNTLDDRMEPVAEELDDLNTDARLALYAKGRVQGKWLLTLAYDSDKEKDDARFGGVIDPRAYYTIYADRNETRYDAATVRKLYVRLERPQFYALFGDYETGLGETQLARYQRALNGGKAEFRNRNIAASAFVADTPYRYRREELQGNGLTGPYLLGSQNILPNSERVTIETRDRLHSERIVESVVLTRHVDYDIDYATGSLRFRAPVLSRSSNLDPQFIVAEYEVDGVGKRVLNAGGRVSFKSNDEKLRIGATVIHDEDDRSKSNLVGVDARYQPNVATEVRAEAAVSEKSVAGLAGRDRATAWLIEAEHHSATVDVLAYLRERQSGFGVGQLNAGENGTRKFGIDTRFRIHQKLSLTGSAWQEDFLDGGARRRAAQLMAEYDSGKTKLRAGVIHADDRLSDGGRNRSTLVKLGAAQRLFNGKLELDGSSEFALTGDDASVDFPTRHTMGARLAVAKGVTLVGNYEIADGKTIKARTARVGFDLAPWAGGRLLATANRQDLGEYGPRSFAAYGLSQSIRVSDRMTVDVTLDGNRTIGGIRARDVLNVDQPVATGGFIGSPGLLTEDFIAVTGGATYRADRWSLTGRAEYRDGELADRYGVTMGALRQLGEGRALGALFTWTRARGEANAPTTQTVRFEMSWAHRPAASQWSWLNKTEVRADSVTNAVAGAPGPIGGPVLTIDGDAKSRRVINSLSVNWTPVGDEEDELYGDDRQWFERGEYAFFWGTRYNFDRFGADDVKGWSNVLGADLRFNLMRNVDLGASGTVRIGTGGDTVSWAGGPTVTLVPVKNGHITIGYNFVGFHDRDFEAERYSRSGPFVTFKLKFDQTSFADLGL